MYMAMRFAYNLGLQTQAANEFTVLTALFRGSWRGQFNIFDSKSVQRLCDLDFGLRIEKGTVQTF